MKIDFWSVINLYSNYIIQKMSVFNSEFTDVQHRYAQKIVLCESIDPYTIPMDDMLNIEDLPSITMLNIWNYFTTTRSYYSQDEFMVKKGLEAHKFFESGWVRKLASKRVSENKIVVVGLVEHSQRINEKPLQPWVLCSMDGTVITVHCTCIAGLGEACSHVGAVLYAVECLVRSRENESKTDFPCQWNKPKLCTIDRFLPLAEMCFAKNERIPQSAPLLDEFNKEEISDWVRENKEKAKIISPLTLVTPDINQEFIKKRTERSVSYKFIVSFVSLHIETRKISWG